MSDYAQKYLVGSTGLLSARAFAALTKADAEIAALRQRVAELEREQSALTKMAREAIPDYPFDPKHPLPLREAVYGLTQALEGTPLACGDLHKELEAARKVCALAHRINLQEPCDCGYTKERCHNERFKDALAAYRATQTKKPRDE